MNFLVTQELAPQKYADCHDIIINGSHGTFQVILQTAIRTEVIDEETQEIVSNISDVIFSTVKRGRLEVSTFLATSMNEKIEFIKQHMLSIYG